jgi:hypothetical protein
VADDAGTLVHLGQQHQAIDTDALDARGVVKRRPDPGFRFRDDSSPKRHLWLPGMARGIRKGRSHAC